MKLKLEAFTSSKFISNVEDYSPVKTKDEVDSRVKPSEYSIVETILYP